MYILFDIGGTNTRMAASTNGRTFGSPVIFKTPGKFTDGMSTMVAKAKELSRGKKIRSISGGFAGPLNANKTSPANSPHLPQWIKKPLTRTLSRTLHAPVYMENDTAIVGLGEATAGAGKKYDIVAYITISTGVNGVRIVHKHIDANKFGFEIGHQYIAPPTFRGAHTCAHCKIPGHLEGFISGSALKRRYHKNPRDIHDKNIWKETAHMLALGLANTSVYWSPDVIVLGGSMMKTPGIPLAEVKKEFSRVLTIFPKKPKVVRATLGDIGGLYGALAYIRQKQTK